jgi:hypothetical protein
MQQSTIKNMAFFGSIMQKYYPGGRKGDYANEDRNRRRRSIKPKVIILSQIAKKQSMEICEGSFESSRECAFFFRGVGPLRSGGRRERATSPPVAVPPANGNRQTAKESLTATVVPSQSCFFFFPFFAAKFFIFKF